MTSSNSKSFKYIVSACLCGVPCRYNGANCEVEQVSELVRQGLAIAVCPEILGGLSTPRAPSEICNDVVVNSLGEDTTEQHLIGAEKVLELAKKHGVNNAVLKDFSPSCGSSMIYDGTFNKKLIPGQGITAELLCANGIKVISAETFILGKK